MKFSSKIYFLLPMNQNLKRKSKNRLTKEPTLFGEKIENSKEVKFSAGNTQLGKVIERARILLWTIRNIWGIINHNMASLHVCIKFPHTKSLCEMKIGLFFATILVKTLIPFVIQKNVRLLNV